jgi:hypothetical protein
MDDHARSITIAFFTVGETKEEITLNGEKVGYTFDHDNKLVKIFADNHTVMVRLDHFLFIRQRN